MRWFKANVCLCDGGVLIVNKPVNVATWDVLMLYSRLSVVNQLAPVNRLDAATSGLVAFSVRRVGVRLGNKIYLCLVRSAIISVRIRMSCWLEVKRSWKLCVSYFFERANVGLFLLTSAVLVTGRRHQLRRQLLRLGFGADVRSWCLHSSKLSCIYTNTSASIYAAQL
ncbi:MAG: pseudouridine synthase [Candidatus Hodgkinia cicadicola]